MRHLLLLLALAVSVITNAAPPVDTMTGIFSERVKTVQVLGPGGDIFAPPVVVLGAGDALDIEFDRLADDREYMRYRVLRCDADWQPSSLAESEYLDGFNESAIENYDFSRGTTVHYVHF